MFKKTFAFFLFMFVALVSRAEVFQSQSNAASVDAQSTPETYRRSSLCIILVTHQGTKYAEDMERQFLKMKLPERYNEHNIQLRVLHTNRSLNSKDIVRKLQSNEVGKQLVAKWFNRDPYTGRMNMDLIHDRGGFNASMSDAERADLTVRGRSLLQEEGVDLIQNTFVLVCDMKYKKRDDAGVWAALGTGLLAAGLDALGQYTGTDLSSSTSQLYDAAGELSDLSGFSVIMDAHLLQLDWTPKDLNRLYTNYWVDETTPAVEAKAHKENFDRDANSFKLNYLGHYKSRSTKIEMESSYGFDDLILDVTDRTVAKSIKELAIKYPVFRPKTQLFSENGLLAYIGTKEDMTRKSRYEVLEMEKKKGEIKYDKKGVLKPYRIWNNKDIRMDEYQVRDGDGSYFTVVSGKKKYNNGSYVIREKQKSYLTGKRKWACVMSFNMGVASLPDYETSHRGVYGGTFYDYVEGESGFNGDMEFSALWNCGKNISWELVGSRIGYRVNAFSVSPYTGFLLHTNGLGKSNTCLFVWPRIGYQITTSDSGSFIDYSVRAGLSFSKKWFIGGEYGANQRMGLSIGFFL